MKMNLKELCGQLARAKEEEAVSTERCNDYLLHQVLRPLMRQETVLLKDVDFNQFEPEDIDRISSYYQFLELEGRKLEQFAGAAARIEPAACKTRRFC